MIYGFHIINFVICFCVRFVDDIVTDGCPCSVVIDDLPDKHSSNANSINITMVHSNLYISHIQIPLGNCAGLDSSDVVVESGAWPSVFNFYIQSTQGMYCSSVFFMWL